MSRDQETPPFISTETRAGRYLFLDLDPPPTRGLTLVCAGREVCEPHYRISRPDFRYHALEFVVGGTLNLHRGGREEVLHPGALFSYGPDSGFAMSAGRGSELVKYFVTFTGRQAAAKLEACGLGGERVLYARPLRWIQDLFDQLIDAGRLNPDLARDFGERTTEMILARVPVDGWSGIDKSSEAQRTFDRCLTIAQECYLEISSVADLAGRCHVDPAYLSRLFRRFSGERPLQLLTRLKTQHAADLMWRQGFSVKAAADAVGFPDPYHFSRVFKRVHGLPPGKLKRP